MNRRRSSDPALLQPIVSAAIVVAGLAIFMVVLYLAVMVLAGAALGSRAQPGLGLSILSVAVVAVAVQPLRQRLHHLANRVVYGKRATPYEAMTELTRRLGSALAEDEALPRTAEVAARSVGAPHGEAAVRLVDGSERRAAWPSESSAVGIGADVVVRDRGEEIGVISVTNPGGVSTPQRALLPALAVQAAPAFRSVRLTADLQERVREVSLRGLQIQGSRKRLVAAEAAAQTRFQEEIRRGPELKLHLMLDALREAEAQLTADPIAAGHQLVGMADDMGRALDELRQLARTLFPALLSDSGVLPALQDHLRNLGIPADVEADSALSKRRFEPRVEAGLYFCAVLALHDAVRERRGGAIELKLEVSNGSVLLTVPKPDPDTEEDIVDRIGALDGRIANTTESLLVMAVPLREVDLQ